MLEDPRGIAITGDAVRISYALGIGHELTTKIGQSEISLRVFSQKIVLLTRHCVISQRLEYFISITKHGRTLPLCISTPTMITCNRASQMQSTNFSLISVCNVYKVIERK